MQGDVKPVEDAWIDLEEGRDDDRDVGIRYTTDSFFVTPYTRERVT